MEDKHAQEVAGRFEEWRIISAKRVGQNAAQERKEERKVLNGIDVHVGDDECGLTNQ
jgi:hypothetical protein